MDMRTIGLDARYTIGNEYCGKEEIQCVARFCGEMVAVSKTKQELFPLVISHAIDNKHCEFKIIASDHEVLWLFNGKRHLIVYGAHAESFYRTDTAKASEEYASCLVHSVESNSVLTDLTEELEKRVQL